MNYPENLLYTKTHEWVLKQANNIVLVGITDFAQHELGDIVFVEFEPINVHKKKEEVLCNLESVKAVASVYMPVSGEVMEINKSLSDDEEFELVNNSPYEKGWLVKIALSNPNELSKLMDAKAYKKFVEEAK